MERYARQLDQQETQLETLNRDSAAAAQRQEQLRQEMDALIASLTLDVEP
ncbi:MAG: hypothetical protein R2712_13925 [Vicinamibacterales bacterium]